MILLERLLDLNWPPIVFDQVLLYIFVFSESYMPTDRVNVPVMINLMLIFIYLFGGALAFTQVRMDWMILN